MKRFDSYIRWKTFHAKSDKKQNISENFNIKHLQWRKADLPEEKKILKEKDTLRISVAAIRRCTVKKVSLI